MADLEKPIGLALVKRFIEEQACDRFLSEVDSGAWSSELKRRVQHFGYRYDYRRKRPSLLNAAPFPNWAIELVNAIKASRVSNQNFDQLIVNEYLPGQGIAPHIDRASFDNEIISISLGSACAMTFSKLGSHHIYSLLLEAGDLLLIRDQARHQWRHGIEARKTDQWQGKKIRRGRRVSLTFRRVLPHSV